MSGNEEGATTPEGHPASQASVRVSPLICIPDILRGLGHEPEPLIRQVGLSPAQFEDPDNEISYVNGSRLLSLCVAQTGCQHFGLLLAERVGSSSLGIAGFMLRFAPDIGTALRALKRNLELHDQGGNLALTMDAKQVVLGYTVHEPGAQAVDQIHDMSVGVIDRLMRELCGTGWKPTRVLLSRQPPPDRAPYRQFFRAPIRFRSVENAVVFPASWLAHVPDSADPLLYRYFEQEVGAKLVHSGTNTVSRLRRVLQASIFNDKLSARHIAHQLGMHERTLHRRLKQEDTSFRQELDNMRCKTAQRLLADSTIQISEIAAALQYADAAVFCRAFKRWTRLTPSQWRDDSGASDNSSDGG